VHQLVDAQEVLRVVNVVSIADVEGLEGGSLEGSSGGLGDFGGAHGRMMDGCAKEGVWGVDVGWTRGSAGARVCERGRVVGRVGSTGGFAGKTCVRGNGGEVPRASQHIVSWLTRT
jgi:hypothetical protein